MPLDMFGAHIPWSQVSNHLQLVFELGLVPEIALKADDLDNLSVEFVDKVAETLALAAVEPTIHAPFLDLNPGAIDPLIRQATAHRLAQTLDVAQRLNARLIVVHPGFDHWRYPGMEDIWISNAVVFFLDFLDRTAGCDCRIAIENIYEQTPDTLVRLVDSIDSPQLGHCFDVGHWHLFGQTCLQSWLDRLTPKLFHLHLHDNTGSGDDHLPIGDGVIDFDLLFSLVAAMASRPSMTLEAHSPEDLIRSHQKLAAR